MLKKLIKLANKLEDLDQAKIDSSQFDDQVATKTSWKPINTSSTSNFDLRKLNTNNTSSYKYVPTYFMIFFCSLFTVAGFLSLIFLNPKRNKGWLPTSMEDYFFWLICLVFILSGFIVYYFASSPISFNRYERNLLKGRGKKEKKIYFSDIYALQLIPRHIYSSDGDYRNYQLNIVFKNGKRENIVSYSNESRAKKDSTELAHFIGVGLWNALKESNKGEQRSAFF